jgi:FtsP/CotA-like multicopper oxidase with cupredoxin domain
MMRRTVWLLLVVLYRVAHADSVVVGPNRDTTIYSESGALSNGAGSQMFTGVTDNGAERRALISFDIAGAVPAGSTITSVSLTLRLTRTRIQNLTVGLHDVSATWGEAGSVAAGEQGAGAAAQPGDATWTTRIYPSTAWATAGGDRSASASATTIVGKDLIDYTWSSPGMAADVQSWLASPSSNQGWILIAQASGTRQTKRFATRSNTDASSRPRLTIVFTPPTPTGACCASDGTCTVVAQPGTACTGTYSGTGTSCVPNACPQPTGACCARDATAACTARTEVDCISTSGSFGGIGTTCALMACPVVLTPFVDPLPIPAVAQPTSGTPGGSASYTMKIVQLQRRLHSALPPTTLWGYDDGTNGPSSPGPTIVTTTGSPIAVTWINDLRDNGALRTTHYMPVDACVSTDAAPRTVMHLHGGHVPPEADGYPEATILPGAQTTYSYPNAQPAATLWYHDHALGITRLNVMMGLAGFYFVRDAAETALGLPSGANEIPLVLADRTVAPTGQVRYPATWQPHVFGDMNLVNGVVWPYLNVRKGKYRFRLLDGATSRTYTLSLSNGATFQVIGTDGGLLAAPVARTSITLMPGERADIVVDFAGYTTGTQIELVNSAPAPFPGEPGEGVVPMVMRFIVTNTAGHTPPLPATLATVTPLQPASAAIERDLLLVKRSDPCTGEAWTINGLSWSDITEKPVLGSTEIWRFTNPTGVAHPMHLHLVQFQILDRQAIATVNGTPMPIGSPTPPAPHEAGWKDTVNVGASERVRVIASFSDYLGKYPYHCHILEHEDWDMMRQFEVVAPPAPDGALDVPDAGAADASTFDDAPTTATTGDGGGCCSANGRANIGLALLVFLYISRRVRRELPVRSSDVH